MRVYKTPEIRNVAVVGHGASGKTSLVDALAFVAGTNKRHGSVKDGTALTDYTPDEIERKYSINLALAVAEWLDTKLNLIDRKSTRLNSSHSQISYAVFCLKKKKKYK